MLRLGAAAGVIGRLNAALACLAVPALAACGSLAGPASTANAGRSPSAVARPAPPAARSELSSSGGMAWHGDSSHRRASVGIAP